MGARISLLFQSDIYYKSFATSKHDTKLVDVFVAALGLIKCLEQIKDQRLLRTCVPIYDLRSNMVAADSCCTQFVCIIHP